MRVAVTVLVLALTAGVNACRLAGNESDAEDPAAVASANPSVSAVEASQPATEPLHIEPVPAPQVAATAASARARVDFDTDVKPILEARCQPCHFPGGVMYERRPFDRPETITALGTKLFTRLKDEGEQQVVREFLAQHPADPP
jgi:hypothetical protein